VDLTRSGECNYVPREELDLCLQATPYIPLAEVRMRAIIALGLRGERSTADALVECAFRAPTDVVEGLQVVRSLEDILAGTVDLAPLKRLADASPAHAVRVAAIRVVCGTTQTIRGKRT
jgi:hypothetical protein